MTMLELLGATTSKTLDGFRAPLLTGAVAMVVTWALTPLVRKLAFKFGAVDDPKQDERRVHKEPTPRWGGIAIYAGMLISILAVSPFAYRHSPFPMYLIGILLIGGLIVAVGALDDLHGYKAKIQALFLLAAGVAVQFFFDAGGRVHIAGFGSPLGSAGGWTPLAWLAVPVTAFYIFIVSKTMDTIDGVDGLAAGIAAIAAATLSIIATYSVHRLAPNAALTTELGRGFTELPRVALVAAAVAGAAMGFLRHNYNPAKIFMGTGGAQVLGFTLACISIVGVMKTAAAAAILVPVLVFGVPIFDAFFVISRRLLSRQPITQADKRHLHHTLLGRGLSQRQTVWVLYTAAAALCAVLVFVVARVYG